jgi:hypothetical protein
MTFPKACSPALILIPSLARSPMADVRFNRSEPARSTKWNLLLSTTHSPSGSGSSGEPDAANRDGDGVSVNALWRLNLDPGTWIPLVKGAGILDPGVVGVVGRVAAPFAAPFPVLGPFACRRLGSTGGGGWVGTNFS